MTGLVGSFNTKFYKNIARQPLAKSFKFLLVIAFLIAIVSAFQFSLAVKITLPQVKAWFSDNLDTLVAQMPEVKVENGVLTLPQEPYIKEWKKEKISLIIEPDEANAYAALAKFDNVIMLTKTKFLSKVIKNDGLAEIKEYSLEKIKIFQVLPVGSGLKIIFENKEILINNSIVSRWLRLVSMLVFPLMLCMIFVWYCIAKTLQVLFFSPVYLIFNNWFKANFSYRELLNIGVYALVPPTVLALIKSLFDLPVPAFGLLYVLIYLFYLAMGIKAAAAKEEA